MVLKGLICGSGTCAASRRGGCLDNSFASSYFDHLQNLKSLDVREGYVTTREVRENKLLDALLLDNNNQTKVQPADNQAFVGDGYTLYGSKLNDKTSSERLFIGELMCGQKTKEGFQGDEDGRDSTAEEGTYVRDRLTGEMRPKYSMCSGTSDLREELCGYERHVTRVTEQVSGGDNMRLTECRNAARASHTLEKVKADSSQAISTYANTCTCEFTNSDRWEGVTGKKPRLTLQEPLRGSSQSSTSLAYDAVKSEQKERGTGKKPRLATHGTVRVASQSELSVCTCESKKREYNSCISGDKPLGLQVVSEAVSSSTGKLDKSGLGNPPVGGRTSLRVEEMGEHYANCYGLCMPGANVHLSRGKCRCDALDGGKASRKSKCS